MAANDDIRNDSASHCPGAAANRTAAYESGRTNGRTNLCSGTESGAGRWGRGPERGRQ